MSKQNAAPAALPETVRSLQAKNPVTGEWELWRLQSDHDALRAECERLRKRLEGAEADTRRLDFLERQEVTIKNDDLLLVNPPKLRSAIDAALEDEPGYECRVHGWMPGLSECPRC